MKLIIEWQSHIVTSSLLDVELVECKKDTTSRDGASHILAGNGQLPTKKMGSTLESIPVL